jgi:hypothetical protein
MTNITDVLRRRARLMQPKGFDPADHKDHGESLNDANCGPADRIAAGYG